MYSFVSSIRYRSLITTYRESLGKRGRHLLHTSEPITIISAYQVSGNDNHL